MFGLLWEFSIPAPAVTSRGAAGRIQGPQVTLTIALPQSTDLEALPELASGGT
jgi:hypothetical protein